MGWPAIPFPLKTRKLPDRRLIRSDAGDNLDLQHHHLANGLANIGGCFGIGYLHTYLV